MVKRFGTKRAVSGTLGFPGFRGLRVEGSEV